jgi:predicted ATPase
VRSALDWAYSPDGDPQLGVALTAAALPLWIRLSLLSECRERVERALANLDDTAETAADLRMRLSAGLGWALMYGVGRAREASAAWTATLELAERLGNSRYRRHALWGLCIDQFNNGNVRTALDFARGFASLVEHSTNPIEAMMGDRILATSLHYLGDQTSARHHIDRALVHEAAAREPHAVSAGFDLLVSTHYFQARILWLQGHADRALRVVAALREGLEQAGEARYLPRFLLLQGEQAQYLRMAGEAGQAVENLDQMLARCEARDEGWYVPELLRIKGEVLRAEDASVADVEALFVRSLEEARRQGALSWELRTATSLARLWLERGRRVDAGALLGAVYARLTEGFSTADVLTAGSLLDALR